MKGCDDMFRYKIDVLQALKDKGYNQTYLYRNPSVLGQKTIQDMRKGIVVGIKSLDKICKLLELQPGDIIEWIPDQE